MKKKKTVKISVFVESHQVGLSQNYFGKIQIQDREFDYNFSILAPIENFKKRTIGEYLKFLKFVDFILFNDTGDEVDLSKKEFRFFVSIVVMSLIMTINEFCFKIHFFLEIPIKKASLLSQKKFACQINS